MSLTGTTIYTHGFGNGGMPSLAKRREMRKSCGPYQWTVSNPDDREARKGRGYYAADDDGTPSRGDSTFYLRSCGRPARIDGWYCDDMQDQTITAVVLRLPHGRGFLAGWTMGKGMASSIDYDVIEDEADAWRIADSMAESAAEREREYQAQHQDDDSDEGEE